MSHAAGGKTAVNQAPDWTTIERLREVLPGKLVLKGVLDPEDAGPRRVRRASRAL
jgi:isopentenyl diphosphate isomerase/L-lactate dehydrogenase-like FMN-dependent dehydrogenase